MAIKHDGTEEEDYPHPTHYCRSDEIIELRRDLKRMHIEIGGNADDIDDDEDMVDELMKETEAAFRTSSLMSKSNHTAANPSAAAAAVTEEEGESCLRPRPSTSICRKKAKRVPEHSYCVVPGAMKPSLLSHLLNRVKKAVVFFSLDSSVIFFAELLRCLNKRCYCVRRRQAEDPYSYLYDRRSSILPEFEQAEEGILLAENGFVFGKPFHGVNLMVQYDVLLGPKKYIQSFVAEARTLIFVDPEETEFICQLEAQKMYWKATGCTIKLHLNEYEFKGEKLGDMPHQLKKLVAGNPSLTNLAIRAYRNYLYCYELHPDKEDIFVYLELDLKAAAGSFCLPQPPTRYPGRSH